MANIACNLPSKPGCYLMKDSQGKVIYVGKATDLKKRASSYFTKSAHDAKTTELVRHMASIDFFVTSNEVEALILENRLIKKHLPRFNVMLKDSEMYAYLLLTKEAFPRLVTARDRKAVGKYFGPFTNAQERETMKKAAIDIFKLRTCRRLPKKECLRYHLGLCNAPCTGRISATEYEKDVEGAKKFMRGDRKELLDRMESEMRDFSEKKMFEQARDVRDRMASVNRFDLRQNMEKDRKYDADVINYVEADSKTYIMVFNVSKGILTNKKEFAFEQSDGVLENFIAQYYNSSHVPDKLIVSRRLDWQQAMQAYLSKIKGGNVEIAVPSKGYEKQLLELVEQNIHATFFKERQELSALKDVLNLPTLPEVIECFDISTIQGSHSVASMVRFLSGKPDKNNYRRFRIKTVEGQDDFSMMREVVGRRYSRLIAENARLPDLIVIDGGRGQLNAARMALKELSVRVPVISLAKRDEEIYAPHITEPIRLDRKSGALKVLQRVRDEAHRFALKYHKLLRSKELDEL